MRTSAYKASLLSVCLPVLALTLGSCTQQDLTPLDTRYLQQAPPTGITVNFCTDPAQVVKSRLKYIIVLDHSGSNAGNYKIVRQTGLPDLSPGNGCPGGTGGFCLQQGLATDPSGYSRYGDVSVPGTLLNFLDTTPENDPNNPLVYFALVDFSGTIGHTFPSSGNGFSSSVRDFEADVLADSRKNNPNSCTWAANNNCDSVGDAGATDYLGALDAVQGLVNSDIAAAEDCANNPQHAVTPNCPKPGTAIASSYVVVFMSDGSPSLAISLGPPIDTHLESSAEIIGKINALTDITTNSRFVDGLNLFTIYYYVPSNPDDTAQALLQAMAKAGNGQFYNVTAGSNLDYRSFVPPSKLIKYTLADAFVTNASVVFAPREQPIPTGFDPSAGALPGQPLLDSDGDGLDDALEAYLGSSPTDPDSDKNGVSDLVEYRLNNAPCGHKNAQGKCAKGSGTVDYLNGENVNGTFIPLCSSFKNNGAQTVNGRVVFPSSSPDGLNDCEKLVLGDSNKLANGNYVAVNAPDSNGDVIPDFVEFKNRVPFQVGTVAAISTQDTDGISYYQKIKTSLPVMVPYTQLLAPKPSRYDWNLLSTNSIRDCYKLVVNDLPQVGPNNVVRVDIVMRSTLLSDSYLYHVGKKAFDGTSQVIEFKDWNDPAEQAAGTWRSWP